MSNVQINRVISVILILSLIISMTSCSSATTQPVLSNPNSTAIIENIEEEEVVTESILDENVLTEYITSEIYLEELVVAEEKITELLLDEETIDEVLLCKTIYVPQGNIDEFSENSQTTALFGDGINLKSVLTKVALGTGVIVTVVILKRVGLSEPIASVVAGAADKSLKFAENGVVIGGLFGGLTGAAGEIDETGRSTAVIGFATATAGLIISIMSLVADVPSVGSTTVTMAAGIKLVVAGISTLAASAGTVYAGYQAVKTFQATDSVDIDWDNIDWNQVGVSAVEKSINNGADGYMWGAIIGAAYGGADGYDYYQKYNTPYSTKAARLAQTPINGGKWSGERGESDFILDEPIKLQDGTEITKISYKNCVPDFSPYQEAQIKITNMTSYRPDNFEQANEALAEYWTKINHNGKSWTAREVETYRKANDLTWHEMNNMESMQLVPSEVNATFGHLGGCGEYNAMIGQEGVSDFD
jgi:hypothetical protein